MSTVYSRPQLSPSELRCACSPHTTYYTNFFVLRTAVIINGQQAEIGFSDKKEITLNCRYPTTECISINFDTISSRVEAVLKIHGVSHVSNFWVGEVPFFQVGFSSEYSLKSFLCSQQKMQGEVGLSISAKLRERQPLAASPSPVSQGFPVEVETELFLVLPEAEDNIRAVSMENCNSCLALWKESEKFDFGAIFRTFRLKKGRATVNSRYGKLSVNVLVSELSDVVEWFHLGLYLGVPQSALLRIERERPFSVIERLSHMLDWWVKNEEKSTWSAVIKALVGIKMRRLAEKMAVKYNVAMPTDAEQRALEALPLQTEASHSTSSLVASLEKLRSDNGKKDEQLEKVLETLKLEFQEKTKAERKLSRSKRELMTARKKMTSLSRKRKEAERMLQLKEKELFFLQQVAIKGSRDLNDVIESKKAEIAQLREQLGGVNSELSRAREEAQQMREKLQQTTIELEKQSINVRELERTRADLERERSRVDIMLKQLCDRSQSERVAPTELDTLKKAVAEKEKEVERLSSQLETKETEKQKLLEQAAKQSQHEEELEDRLVQLTAEISDLTASLVEAKDGSAKAEVEVEDLKSRQSVLAELDDQKQKTDKSQLSSEPVVSDKGRVPEPLTINEPVPPGTRVMAKYNFHGSASNDLPFKKGETLEVVSSKNPNWYKARRCDGLEGMIPFNYVMVVQPLPIPSAPALAVEKKAIQAIDVPPSWSPQTSDFALVQVSRSSSEWNNATAIFHKTLPNARIHQLDRIQNLWLWEKYGFAKQRMLKKNSGIINERLLFHGTSATPPQKIFKSEHGFDFRCANQGYWGEGAYFSLDASYSDRYAHPTAAAGKKQIILVKVLVGYSCSFKEERDRTLKQPPVKPHSSRLGAGEVFREERYDTVHGYADGSNIYVVYDHDKAYPAYLITYQTT